jgi:hypothetical protein
VGINVVKTIRTKQSIYQIFWKLAVLEGNLDTMEILLFKKIREFNYEH